MTIIFDSARPIPCAGQSKVAPFSEMAERRSIADVAECLMAEFAVRIDVSIISGTVLDCRDELLCSPSGAAPRLVEHLARQRLRTTASRSETP